MNNQQEFPSNFARNRKILHRNITIAKQTMQHLQFSRS